MTLFYWFMRSVFSGLRGKCVAELTKQDVMSRLIKLEQRMNDLDRNADALTDELESLEAVARELKMTDSIDKFNKFIEEVRAIKEETWFFVILYG
jgi:hypothetical protein